MPYYLNLGENLKKLLSYLKSSPLNFSNLKFHVKQQKNEYGTKNTLFGSF